MSNAYFETARTVIAAILNESSGHEKSDEWFFPAIYLYRQAIELLCKGLLATSKNSIFLFTFHFNAKLE